MQFQLIKTPPWHHQDCWCVVSCPAGSSLKGSVSAGQKFRCTTANKNIRCTLISWVHQILMLFRTFSQRLEDINAVLTVFHIDHISQGVCKTGRTTFWCIIVIQSRGEGHEKANNYGTDLEQIFRTFSPQLENNNRLKCHSDSFAHTLRYVINVKTVGTRLKCIDILQSRGEVHK